MGVDLCTYRCRIGTFCHGSGLDVVLLRICVNYNGYMKMVGAVTFIGLLLLMAGVEANPGPKHTPLLQEVSDSGDQVSGVSTFGSRSPQMSETSLQKKPLSLDKCEDKSQSANDESCLQMEFKRILKEMELEEWFPGKISVKNVTTVEIDEDTNEKEQMARVPWVTLQRIIMADSKARDHTIDDTVDSKSQDNDEDDLLAEFECVSEGKELSPLDAFIVIFQCCNAMLKQVLFKKLFLCRIAVPFIHIDQLNNCPTMSVWPLRSLVVERKKSDQQPSEMCMFKNPTRFVVFARFGRPLYSKSKLQNDLLSDQKHDTFYNYDSPYGMCDRYLTHGYVEAAWYVPSENEKEDTLGEVLTFLNIRGDYSLEDNKHLRFIENLGNVFIIVVDMLFVIESMSQIQERILNLSYIIIVVTYRKGLPENDIKKYALNVKELRKKLMIDGKEVTIISDRVKGRDVNSSEMKKTITSLLKKFLSRSNARPMRNCIKSIHSFSIVNDEHVENCKKGKKLAHDVLDEIKKQKPPTKWKELITPLQFTYWKKLSKLNRRFQRSFNDVVGEREKITQDIKHLNSSQTDNISPTMKCFVDILNSHVDNEIEILFFIEWLNIFLNKSSYEFIQTLRTQYIVACDKLTDLKNEKDSQKQNIETQNKIVKSLEMELANASFGIEHLFREMGQLYDIAHLSSDSSLKSLAEKMSLSVAKLITYGQPFEILDGDTSNIQIAWIKSVFRSLENSFNIGQCPRCLILSVLGIQGSGKSTLLNTMFGSQYAVSAGRCTRGAYMQLVKIKTKEKGPFDHLMIIDSEGLRAPELREQNKDRDNELATFVIGLGDITILNIKGENTSEIHDILEITVHAFLRLSIANNNIDMKQKCLFVHQNVAAVNAAEKMRPGLQRLVECLDEMTQEAAINENITDISSFNQVIGFDGNKHVWYMSDLWQGNPPMAVVNNGYSKGVKQLRKEIIEMAMSEDRQSYKSFTNTFLHIRDLWKGILAEDFIFSFRNSLEIKAYLLLDSKYKQLAWQFESFVQKSIKQSSNKFKVCSTEVEVNTTLSEIKKSLLIDLSRHQNTILKELELFFDDNDYQQIMITWKENKLNCINALAERLEQSIYKEIEKLSGKRKIQLMTTESCQQHEQKLQQASLELANKLQGSNISAEEIDRTFEEIWNNVIKGIKSENDVRLQVSQMFISVLYDLVFNTGNKDFIHHELRSSLHLEQKLGIKQLHGSYYLTKLDSDNLQKNVMQYAKNFVTGGSAVHHVQYATEDLFQELDTKIDHMIREENEISNMQVKELLRCVEDWVAYMDKMKNKNRYSLKYSFKVRLYIHVSCYASQKFQIHNDEFRKTHGIHAQLNKCKIQYKTLFEAHLQNRKAEVTAAKLFWTELEHFMSENVKDVLSLSIEHDLMTYIPSTKYQLLISILTDLAQDDSFEDFISYIKNAKTFVDKWIVKTSNSYLFKKKMHQDFPNLLQSKSIV